MKVEVVVMVVVMVVVRGEDPVEQSDIASQPSLNQPAMDNWIARLYKDKMRDYNKNARPVHDHTKTTMVTLGLSLKNIDVDDEAQELIVNAWSIMSWQDESLQWVPKDYVNIDRIHFDDQDIWRPDIRVYNSAEGTEAQPFGAVPVLVDYKGRAYWFPPTRLAVKCDLDLTSWPRDQHECLVRMGSWAHHGEQIDLQTLSNNSSVTVMTDTLEVNSRWHLINVTASRALTSVEGHDPYVEVNFAFRVQRQARTQATYITQSTLAVVVVVLASYLLPLHRFLSRLLMHLFPLALLITCFFTLFARLPSSGGPVPLVVRYYSGAIILTTLSLLSTLCLATRACCCCCSNPPTSAKLGKTLSTLRNVVNPQARTTQTPYSNLDNELTIEEADEASQRPSVTQLNQGGSARYVTLDNQEEEAEGGQVNAVTSHQFVQVINYLLLALFTVAFVVDYVVLRNVTL